MIVFWATTTHCTYQDVVVTGKKKGAENFTCETGTISRANNSSIINGTISLRQQLILVLL